MAIATGAAAVAAATSVQAAAAARRAECVVLVKGYQHDKATTAEMRQYADCIDTLHPDRFEPGIGMLVIALVLLAGIAIGAVRELLCGPRFDGPIARFFFGALQGFVGGLVVLGVGGLVLLAAWAWRTVAAGGVA